MCSRQVYSDGFPARVCFVLSQGVAYDPGLLAPILYGDSEQSNTYVQDTEALSKVGEQLSWWQLMVRSFFTIPSFTYVFFKPALISSSFSVFERSNGPYSWLRKASIRPYDLKRFALHICTTDLKGRSQVIA
jgi:hypothetical protein